MNWELMCNPGCMRVEEVELTREELFLGARAAIEASKNPNQRNSAGYNPTHLQNILFGQAGFWSQMAVAKWLGIENYTPGVDQYKQFADVGYSVEVRWASYVGLTLRPAEKKDPSRKGDAEILYRDFVLVTGIFEHKNGDSEKGLHYRPDGRFLIWGWRKGYEIFGQKKYLATPDPKRDPCYVCPAKDLNRKGKPGLS